MTEHRKNFVEATETLLVTEVSSHGKLYFAETPFFGTEMCTDAVLDNLPDCAVCVERLNIETRQSEDITELCARQYLFVRDHDHGIEADDEKTFPMYVQGSAAWAKWKSEIEADAAAEASQAEVYSSLQHSTMDARTQGLRHG